MRAAKSLMVDQEPTRHVNFLNYDPTDLAHRESQLKDKSSATQSLREAFNDDSARLG